MLALFLCSERRTEAPRTNHQTAPLRNLLADRIRNTGRYLRQLSAALQTSIDILPAIPRQILLRAIAG